MRTLALALATLLGFPLLPAHAQVDEAAIVRGTKWLAARKALDEGHLGRRSYAVFKDSERLGDVVVIVSKARYRGKPEYRVQTEIGVEIPGVAEYEGASEARVALALTLRTLRGEMRVAQAAGEAEVVYSAARRSKGVAWSGGPENKQQRKGLTPAAVLPENLTLSFPRVLKDFPEGQGVRLPSLDGDKGEIRWTTYTRGKAIDIKIGEATVKALPVRIAGKTGESQAYLDPETGHLLAMTAHGLTYRPDGEDAEEARPKGPQPKDTVARMLVALARKDTRGYLACFDVKAFLIDGARRRAGSPELVDSAEADAREAYAKNPAKARTKFAKRSMSSVNEIRKQLPTDPKTWRTYSRQEVTEDKAVVHVKYGQLDLTYTLVKTKKTWLIVGRR